MSNRQTRVSPPNRPAVPADSKGSRCERCGAELGSIVDSQLCATCAPDAPAQPDNDPLSIPPQTLPGGVGQSIDLPAHELPWREDEKDDPNYGRTCVCGAAIRSGGRIEHQCRMPAYEKLRAAVHRLVAHAEELREENVRLQGAKALGTPAEISNARAALAVFESVIRRRVEDIQTDDRYAKDGEPKANVQVNAPLALIQLEGTASVNALLWVLGERLACAGSYPARK